MPTIIDELVAVFRIDTKQAKKDAADAKKTVDSVATVSKTSEKDQERVERSREVSREKRRKDRERKDKEEVRQKKKNAQEVGSAIESVGRQAFAAVVGFEGLRGAINFLGGLNTATAALGRNSANLGVGAKDLQTYGNAVELLHGNADAARASFQGLAQQITAFKTRGEVGPLLQLASNAGVFPRDANGQFKSPDVLLPQIVDALTKQGYSRPDVVNLGTSAGISEDLLNVLLAPNRNELLATGRKEAFANDGNIERSQKIETFFARKKQEFKTDTVNFIDLAIDHPLQAWAKAIAEPLRGTVEIGNTLYASAKDALEKPATVGVRNNNPGNIEDNKGVFRKYVDMATGWAALQKDIDIKIDKDGLNSVRSIISKYAPPTKNGKFENDTEAYINDVAAKLGLDPDDPITTRAQRFGLVDAIARHEQGGKGYAQVRRALATPDAAGSGSSSTSTTNIHIDNVAVNAPQAKDADGVAESFFGAMQRKGVIASQSNTGQTP